MYLALIKSDEKIYMMSQKEEDSVYVAGFDTESAALNYFEAGYNRKHAQSYEGSMSALINWMYLTPSIIEVKDDADLIKIAASEPKVFKIGSRAGIMLGISTSDLAKDLWEKGTKPSISPKYNE